MTTSNEQASTSTSAPRKIAARYAALVDVANKIPGVEFEPVKRPTAKDCEELAEFIEREKQSLASRVEVAVEDARAEKATILEPQANAALDENKVTVSVDASGKVLDAYKAVVEKQAKVERLRREAHEAFFSAEKATSGHAHALLRHAAEGGADRVGAMRAFLAQLPEGIRADTCRIAFKRIVQSGPLHDEIKSLCNEQPTATRPAKNGGGGGRKDALTQEAIVRKANGGEIIVRGTSLKPLIGVAFKVEHKVEDGKLVIVLKQV